MNETSADQTKESPKVTTKAKKAVKDEFFSKPNASLEDAKKWLRERFGKGATCPCCNQFVKLYRRPFNYSMAVVLLLMERYYRRVGVSAEEWLHVPSYITEAVAYHPRGAVARPSVRDTRGQGGFPRLHLQRRADAEDGRRADHHR
jgi:hypothetical protein